MSNICFLPIFDNGGTVDSYPVLDSTHGTVYYSTVCDNSAASYSNSSATHVGYDVDGFCTNCGGYQPATQNSNGIYEISNAGKLFWFASLVNGDTAQEGITAADTTASEVLTANINLGITTTTHTDTEWTPIGTKSAPYTGTFNGNGYTVSGMSITTAAAYMGLFGYVSAGTVKNLSVSGVDSSSIVSYTGAIVGRINQYVGEVSNCYYWAETGSTLVGIGANGNSSATVETTAKDADEFAGGEVAYLLQNGRSSQVWGQDLTGQTTTTGDDSYPVLSSDGNLYVVKVSFYYRNGDTAESEPFDEGYTNYGCVLASYPSESNAAYTYYTYDGGLFFIKNGLIDFDANELCLYGDVWYYVSLGQVQLQYTGLAIHDGAWFYITEGILDATVNGLIPYDGERFLVAAGRLVFEYSGLWLNSVTIGGNDQWYFLATGMVCKVSQVVMYDGAFFVVVDGILDTGYNGTIAYGGAVFTVVNGQLYS